MQQPQVVRTPLGANSNLVFGDTGRLCGWASERMGRPALRWPKDTVCIGLEEAGDPVAVILYDRFTSQSCDMHLATNGGKKWATRASLYAFFAFPFIQCGFSRVGTHILRSNVASQILALKLGFTFEGRICSSLDGEDGIILGMLKQDCRWIALEKQDG